MLGDLAIAIERAKFLGFLVATPEEWFRGPQTYIFEPTGGIRFGGSAETKFVRGREGIEKMIAARVGAKARRDFVEADRIRDELKAEGVLLEDGPQGTTWRRA